MAGTAADAIAEIGERMLKEKDARIAELESALRIIRDALAPGALKTDPALLDDPFEWIDNVARVALNEQK